MKKVNTNSVTRLLNALKNSFDGLKAQWRHERAFRQELLVCIITIPVLLLLNVAAMLKLLLMVLLLLLLVVETINSAIETIVDRISLERHEKSKIAKDLGSAAVGLTILMNLLAWGYAFWVAFV